MMNREGIASDGNDRLRKLAEIDLASLPADGGDRFNRLIFARSPYLLQHAENPVDWFPWGEEAFARAKSEDKPVFLSIGYATCHWCHVMERESFEDEEVAAVLNDNYICIKVDREERPDLDDQYMTVAQLMTGGGGWPLTIVMTPDKLPFFAATYLPKTPRKDMPGIIKILDQISMFWKEKRDAVMENCSQVMQALKKTFEPFAGTLENDEIMAKAFQVLMKAYDDEWAGFGGAPKFPLPHYLSFLIRFWKKSRAVNALWMSEDTVKMIRRGGIFDQLGLGIHRYAVDKQWLIPHFEKMLYDQAMLGYACLELFQATGDARYRIVAEEIFAFVLDEMRSPEGGFYSAWDADTAGVEGMYYTWTPREISLALSVDEAASFCRLFGVSEEGNFEGRSILHLPVSLEEFAEKEGMTPESLRQKAAGWRERLLEVRKQRPKPLRDEKILSSWNALMIAALAKGYAVTGEKSYLDAAETALRFLDERLRTNEGRLLRSWYQGTASVPAFLEDHAFLGWALIQLYEATLEQGYLEAARSNARKILQLFVDPENFGLFDTAADNEDVLVRKKGGHDGVTPSGNAAAALNFVKIGKACGDTALLDEGKGILRAFMGTVTSNPMIGLHFLTVLDYLNSPETEITFAGPMDTREAVEMLRAVHKRFIPGLVLRRASATDIPMPPEATGKTVVQICAAGACGLPLKTVAELEAALDEFD